MTDLLPCPFCGSPARDDLLPHSGGPGWVQCSSCEADQHMSDTLEEAVARWNRRAPQPACVAQAEPKHDHRVFFVCECCEEHAPENGVSCREDIGVMPDGTWLCDGCYSDCDKSAHGMIASDVDDFEFPRFEDLPRPAAYPLSSTQEKAAAPDQYEFPYQQTFEAIAAATEIYPSKEQALGLSISVKKFQETFNGHRDRRPLTAFSVSATHRGSGE